jgi:hypothetical protein
MPDHGWQVLRRPHQELTEFADGHRLSSQHRLDFSCGRNTGQIQFKPPEPHRLLNRPTTSRQHAPTPIAGEVVSQSGLDGPGRRFDGVVPQRYLRRQP